MLNDRYIGTDGVTQDRLYNFALQWRDVITAYGFEKLLDSLFPTQPSESATL